MDPFFAWIEDGAFSTALRESEYAFPFLLTGHVFSVALVAGTTLPIALRLAGFLRGVPMAGLTRYLPIFWAGLVVSTFTGGLLLISYPTKSMTNPVFWLKLAAIIAAIVVVWRVRGAERDGREVAAARPLGFGLLGLWGFVILAGRLLAYTYSRLMVGF